MRIGVIGSGIGGLVATWRLGLDHEVELIEARDQIGMDAGSVSVDQGGVEVRVDVPLRVFGSGYYPNLVRLYGEAEIPRGRANYSASFSELGGPTYFAYRSLRWGERALSLPSPRVGGSRSTLRRLAEGARMYLTEPARLAAGQVEDVPLDTYLRARGYAPEFREDVLYVTLAAVLTCTVDAVRAYPAPAVLDFLGKTLGTAFGRVADGTRAVVRRLSERAKQVHLRTPIAGIRSEADGVAVVDRTGTVRRYDHVIMATQAHRVLDLLDAPGEAEREAFSRFSVSRFRCVVHRDPALMPRDRGGWRPINALRADAGGMPMYTMWMNRILPDVPEGPALFQSINPLVDPAPERVVSELALDRPLLTVETLGAVRRVRALHEEADRRVWFCGSYLTEGLPLLEAATISATDVAERIQARARISA